MFSQIKFRLRETSSYPRILVHTGTVLVMMIFSYLTSPVSSLLTPACALELETKVKQRFVK